MEAKQESIKKVNELLGEILVGSGVESFGLMHQILFIDFRDITANNNNRLSIDCQVELSGVENAIHQDQEAHALHCFYQVNLMKVTNVLCDEEMNLLIEFENGEVLKINGGNPESEGEPWQFYGYSLALSKHISIIAASADYVSIWGLE